MQVAATYDSNVARNAEACVEDCIHRAKRQRIVVAEDAVRTWIALQKQAHGFSAFFCALRVHMHAADHVVRV